MMTFWRRLAMAPTWLASDADRSVGWRDPSASLWRRLQRALLRRLLRAWQRREQARACARQARRAQALRRAELEACADESPWLEFATVVIDGKSVGALYRDGQLMCLLPETQRL